MAFLQIPLTYITPPINPRATQTAYRSDFEGTVGSKTDFYVMFGQQHDMKKQIRLKPARKISYELRGDLKLSAYNMFHYLLDAINKLSHGSKERAIQRLKR